MIIKPISYMKANAANLSEEIGFEPMYVTQNGVDSLVVQTSEAYKSQLEKMAFMELLIKSEQEIKQGEVADLDDFLSEI
ncbi:MULTISPECIES: type II toxin-antitoxin system Phd/YefM family antitoxin [unclassified Pseudoalteromonas]|uniref:type II toxin-antitoxin system Phd/YefM family antitoxin n=1 Tax=unclassified Pseudoalteromonas TaxID=194690 RepID=UPI0005AAB507|nr:MULTISPECIES: type II toxin-antitoxin system Phd/YefM family antitoxin [unclassified Pseudoalteromonas]